MFNYSVLSNLYRNTIDFALDQFLKNLFWNFCSGIVLVQCPYDLEFLNFSYATNLFVSQNVRLAESQGYSRLRKISEVWSWICRSKYALSWVCQLYSENITSSFFGGGSTGKKQLGLHGSKNEPEFTEKFRMSVRSHE